MVSNALQVMSMVPAKDMERAHQFYTDVLGLSPESMGEGGPPMYVTENGARIIVYMPNAPYTPTHTLLTFMVADIEAAVSDLKSKGVTFDHVEMPNGASTDEDGILRDGVGRVAWFKDSEGNTIGLAAIAQ